MSGEGISPKEVASATVPAARGGGQIDRTNPYRNDAEKGCRPGKKSIAESGARKDGGAKSGALSDEFGPNSQLSETFTGNSLLDAIRLLTDMPPAERAALIELLKT